MSRGSVATLVNCGYGTSNWEYEICGPDKLLLGSVMIPAKGLLTLLFRQATVSVWQGLFGSGDVMGKLSTQDPR